MGGEAKFDGSSVEGEGGARSNLKQDSARMVPKSICNKAKEWKVCVMIAICRLFV